MKRSDCNWRDWYTKGEQISGSRSKILDSRINEYVARQHRKRNTICSGYFVPIRYGNETWYALMKFRN